MQSSERPEEPDLVLEIVRDFDAPPALVFRMWREPEHMLRWHGPVGFALTACEIDFRVGGKWRRCMSKGPGHAHWISGVYREIVEPWRLSFTYVNDYDQHEMLVTMDFAEIDGGKTRMFFRQEPFISVDERDGHAWGWNSGFALLAAYVVQFDGIYGAPIGRPRRDGALEDFEAARERARLAKRAPATGQSSPGRAKADPEEQAC
jgi:uncharacterized protein YndB with AHSA1/START domain